MNDPPGDPLPTYQVLPHDQPDAVPPHLVPPDARCPGCNRRAGLNTKFGPHKLQWDRRTGLCGPCFDERYQGRLFPDDPGDRSGVLET